MSRNYSWLLCSLLLVTIVGVPLGYAKYQKAHLRNFRAVEPGKLYRSGQLSLEGLRRVGHDHGIKTVVSLRFPKEPGEAAPDASEEHYCGTQQLNFFRLPHKSFWKGDQPTAPADENVARFLAIMDNANNHPVLVHCFAGKHRTGAMVAIYRMEYQGWSNAAALAELEANGYEHLDEHYDVRGYLETYVPRRLKKLKTCAEEKLLPTSGNPAAN